MRACLFLSLSHHLPGLLRSLPTQSLFSLDHSASHTYRQYPPLRTNIVVFLSSSAFPTKQTPSHHQGPPPFVSHQINNLEIISSIPPGLFGECGRQLPCTPATRSGDLESPISAVMATTASLSAKSKLGGPASLKITPSNSPSLRPGMRSPSKSAHQSSLSLQTVIGTTTTTPNGFSSHDQSRSFALCAGSAAVLAELDDDGNISQRFFRARPSATSVNPTTSFYNPSTPPATPDSKLRSLAHIRSNPHLNLHNASPSNEVPDYSSPRTWSSRERVKAVTSVSISPNGRFLAVGEVSGRCTGKSIGY